MIEAVGVTKRYGATTAVDDITFTVEPGQVTGFLGPNGQRLGIAAALLGDPSTVVLDEPVNGLDPDGVIWIRELLRTLGNEGRTVLVSSHLMPEMAMVATRLLIIGPVEADGRGGQQVQVSGIPIETIGTQGSTRPPRVTLPRVIASEWTKLRSLRSTWWTLVIAVVAMIGLSALFATSIAATGMDGFGPGGPGGPLAALDGVAISLNGVMLAQLAFGILGVLMIASEYASGTITASLAAVPRRWPLLAAKTVILTGLTLTVGLAASLSAFSIGQGLLAGTGIEVALGDPGILRAVAGAGVYLTLVTILGLGLGALLRHTAGGIAVLVGVLLLLGPLSAALPSSWQDAIGPYLPATAGDAMMTLTQTPGSLDPWTGFAVLTGYALATLTVATLLLLSRDT